MNSHYTVKYTAPTDSMLDDPLYRETDEYDEEEAADEADDFDDSDEVW